MSYVVPGWGRFQFSKAPDANTSVHIAARYGGDIGCEEIEVFHSIEEAEKYFARHSPEALWEELDNGTDSWENKTKELVIQRNGDGTVSLFQKLPAR